MSSRDKPACLVVCSGHSKGVSAPSFIHAFTLTASTFNVFLATPEGRPMDFVDVDDGNRQWVEDFMTKPMSVPLRLETLESSKFTALLLPSSPGALFDLCDNRHLGALICDFIREKKPLCSTGCGVAGFFSAWEQQTKKWALRDYSMTAPSVLELARRDDFTNLPVIPSDLIRKHGATYSACSRESGVHVVVDGHLVTGQNGPSTLTAVQNLILISNARLTRPR